MSVVCSRVSAYTSRWCSRRMLNHPVIPVRDPRLQRAIDFENACLMRHQESRSPSEKNCVVGLRHRPRDHRGPVRRAKLVFELPRRRGDPRRPQPYADGREARGRAQRRAREVAAAPMPIDKAMEALARRGRNAFPGLAAKPSGDLSAMSGWVDKPGFSRTFESPAAAAEERMPLALGASAAPGGAEDSAPRSVMSDQKRRFVAPIAGMVVGVGVFVGVNVSDGSCDRAQRRVRERTDKGRLAHTRALGSQPPGSRTRSRAPLPSAGRSGIPYAFPPLAGSSRSPVTPKLQSGSCCWAWAGQSMSKVRRSTW